MTQACFHCGDIVDQNVGSSGAVEPVYQIEYKNQNHVVCCIGCKAVAEFIISSEQSSNYYDLRENSATKVESECIEEVTQWEFYDDKPEFWGEIKLLDEQSAISTNPAISTTPKNNERELYLDINGIHCSACSWLIRTKLQNLSGVQVKSIDASTGVAVVLWKPDNLKFSAILKTITLLGYRPSLLGEKINDDEERNRELKRLVVAGLGMMQVMMYSVALYAGEWEGMDPIYTKFLTWVSLFVTTPVLFYSGLPFLKNALISIKNFTAHMDIPIALAISLAYTLSCINFFRDQGSVYFESVVMFIFFISIARFIQHRLQYKNMKTQQAISRMLPNFVNLVINRNESNFVQEPSPKSETEQTLKNKQVPLSVVKVDQELSIATGEIIPVDAILLSEQANIEESLLTGESDLISKIKGEKLSAGCINSAHAIIIKTTTTSQNSSLSVLGRRLATNNLTKNDFQIRLAHFASIFVVSVLGLAVLTLLFWAREGQFEKGLETALAVLVISCPCALSLAIPASLAALSHSLHRQGMHVMNSDALIQFSHAKTILFDKTGTLTKLSLPNDQIQVVSENGVFDDNKTVNIDPQEHYLAIISALEKNSIHPVAKVFHSFQTSYVVTNFKEEKGKGVSGIVNNIEYIFAKTSYLKALGVQFRNSEQNKRLHLVRKRNNDYELLANIQLDQNLRPNTKTTIEALQNNGLNIQIISGDHADSVEEIASKLNIKQFLSEQSSEQKFNYIKQLQKQGLVAAVGDGINDAEVLNKANISISFTNATHIAQASADVLLSGQSLAPVQQLYIACKKLNSIVKTNIIWAISYNVIFIPLAAMGYIQPWMAALGMSLSSLFVVINASRLSKVKILNQESQDSELLDSEIQNQNQNHIFMEKVT